MRAIVWANQPPWWRRFLLFAFPGGEQLAFTLRDRLPALGDLPMLVLWGSRVESPKRRDGLPLFASDPSRGWTQEERCA